MISGSLLSWGLEVVDRLDLVVFLYLDPEIRIGRSLARERLRYGDRILPGGDMHEAHLKFIEWSRAMTTGRSAAAAW